MSKKLKIFIIVCVVVFLTGLAATITGLALHGWKDVYNVPGNWHINLNAENSKTLLLEGDAAKFHSLDVDMTMCQVKIVQGDQYKVELKYNSQMPKPDMKIKNGMLTIQTEDTIRLEDDDENFAIELQITIPKGTTLKEASLDMNFGQMEISALHANALDLSVNAGELTAKGLAFDEADIDVSFCSGDIEMVGEEADYDYDVDTNLSTVYLNHEEVNNMEKSVSGGNPTFELNCNLSDVSVTFQQSL